jgi:hypothetical protein
MGFVLCVRVFVNHKPQTTHRTTHTAVAVRNDLFAVYPVVFLFFWLLSCHFGCFSFKMVRLMMHGILSWSSSLIASINHMRSSYIYSLQFNVNCIYKSILVFIN